MIIRPKYLNERHKNNSSNSYVSYEPLLEKSTQMAKAEAFDFRYPETWDKTYNTYRKKVNVNH